MTDSQSRKVPPGGSATINGVLYQLLWSLLQASKATITRDSKIVDNELTDVLIKLEPVGGGGDLIVETESRKSVEQLKARPDGGTWSLREIIEKVIPDLYLAAIGTDEDIEFRFVTEGRIGNWKKVYQFFQSLKNIECPDDPLNSLDDKDELKFHKRLTDQGGMGSGNQFWDLASYTRRSLFEKVVVEVRKRSVVKETETETETHKNLWRMLGDFVFVGGQFREVIQKQIDSYLLGVVDISDDVPTIRKSLVMELASLATIGGKEINCEQFFKENGLNAIPLFDLTRLRKATQKSTRKSLKRLRYEYSEDVRLEAVQDTINNWPETSPVLVISGESGCGKSWRSYGICESELESERLCVISDPGDNIDYTLSRAANRIWQEIAGHDQQIPLIRIGRRLRKVLPGISFPWLTLIIDGAIDSSQAKELIAQDWDEWGVRVVLTLQLNDAVNLESKSQGRCKVVSIGDFTTLELQNYLESFLGETWPEMPSFIRNPLRKPLLAAMYRSIIESQGSIKCLPESEYQLFQKFWDQVDNAYDKNCLVQLAEDYIKDGTASWPVEKILAVGGNSLTTDRLEAIGWLRRANSDLLPTFEFSHVRLLNWAAALSLVARYTRSDDSQDEIENQLRQYLWREPVLENRWLDYLTMDFLWMACNQQRFRSYVPQLIDKLANDNYLQAETIYRKLLPTLGSIVLDTLDIQLRKNIQAPLVLNLIIDAIGEIGGNQGVNVALRLLTDESPLVQVAAARILSKCPHEDALDALWSLHCECQNTTEKYSSENDQFTGHRLYQTTFSALKGSSQGKPDWIGEMIREADRENKFISDLVFLLSEIPDDRGKSLWIEHKNKLFSIVPKTGARCLVRCVDVFSDHQEIERVCEYVGANDHHLSSTALKALSRLDPLRAIEHLEILKQGGFVFTSDWFSLQLLVAAPELTRVKVRKILTGAENIWPVARFYNNRFEFVDPETFDVLIAGLEHELEDCFLEPGDFSDHHLYEPLHLLVQANTHEQLQHLSKYSGSKFEQFLVEHVARIGPRSGVSAHSLSYRESIGILLRINGNGFCKAITTLLLADNRYGRYDGLAFARMKSDSKTINCLIQICQQSEKWDDHYIEQCMAAEVLAANNIWKPVLSLIKQIGFQTLSGLTDLPLLGIRPDPKFLSEVADRATTDKKSLSSGDIITLGFGIELHAEIVSDLSKHFDSESEHAKACVFALRLLSDTKVENLEFLGKQLDVGTHSHLAVWALIANGSQAALELLSDHAGEDLEDQIAAVLINNLEDNNDAIERAKNTIVRRIEGFPDWQLVDKMLYLVLKIKDQEDLAKVFSDPAIGDMLRTWAFVDDYGGLSASKKPDWIKCLSVLDKNAAFIAAKSAFLNSSTRNRHRYPSLLMYVDESAAISFLLEAIKSNDDIIIRAAIGRALARIDLTGELLRDLDSADTELRLVACLISRWQKPSLALEEKLRLCVSDRDESVSHEAAIAISSLRTQREVNLLGESLLHTDDDSVRWILLECILNLCDVGDESNPWPLQGPEIVKALSPSQFEYCIQTLKNKRKREVLK